MIRNLVFLVMQTIVASQGKPSGEINLSLQDVTVKEALVQVTKQSGFKLVVNQSFAPLSRKVSVTLHNATLDAALSEVMRGTGAIAHLAPDGQTVVVEFARKRTTLAQGAITGRVTDAKSGKGITGANISLDAQSQGIMSSDDGSYKISGVSSATHTVTVRLVGYAKQTKSVTVGDGAVATVDFKLEPSANVLEDVVVTGTVVSTELKAVPSAITVITAKQIEERGITRIDQLFRGEIPGLFSMEQGTGAPLGEVIMFSRGATKIPTSAGDATLVTNPIKTYVDGVEMADPQYLSQIDPKSIERVEILTGPQASTIYGANAINGVMQIFTKRGSTIRPNITLNLSSGLVQNSFSSALTLSHIYDGNASGSESKFSYNVGGGWNYTGPWSPGKQFQRVSAYGGGRYQSGDISVDASVRRGQTRNILGGSLGQTNTELGENGTFVYTTGLNAFSKQFLYGTTFGSTLSYTPLSWWSHQLTVGTDASDDDFLGFTARLATQNDTNFSGRSSMKHRVSQSYSSTFRIPVSEVFQATLTYGADHWRNHSSTITWTVFGLNLVPSTISRSNTDRNSGMYVQGQFGFWDALFLTYGVRADWNPNFGAKAKTRPGRYGVSYSREFGIVSAKLRGSYGRSIRPPDAGLISGTLGVNSNNKLIYGDPHYTRVPNDELGPEFQQGGEGGIELYIGNSGSLVVTRYNQTVDGLINSVPGVDSLRALNPGPLTANCTTTNLRSDGYCYLLQGQWLNVGSVRNQGWELQGSVNTGPFSTKGTYSWSKSRIIGVTERYRSFLSGRFFVPGSSPDFTPEHTWAMNVSYIKSGTSVSLNVNGVGKIIKTNGDLDLVSGGTLRLRVTDAQLYSLPFVLFPRPTSGYTTANVNASHRFSSKLESTLQITNLTNFYRNDVDIVNPTIGRQTRLGIRVRFQ